jgi:hypothetical protein
VLRSIAECWDDLPNLGKGKDAAALLKREKTAVFRKLPEFGTALV